MFIIYKIEKDKYKTCHFTASDWNFLDCTDLWCGQNLQGKITKIFNTLWTPVLILYTSYTRITNSSLLPCPYTHHMCIFPMYFLLCSPEIFLQSVSHALQSGEVFIDIFIAISALLNLWTTSDIIPLTSSGNLIFLCLFYLSFCPCNFFFEMSYCFAIITDHVIQPHLTGYFYFLPASLSHLLAVNYIENTWKEPSLSSTLIQHSILVWVLRSTCQCLAPSMWHRNYLKLRAYFTC